MDDDDDDRASNARFKAAMAKADEEQKILPRPVGCMQGKIEDGSRTYDAELVVGGKHYVVKRRLNTHEAAIAVAEKYCEELRARLRGTTAEYLRGYNWPEAKE